MPGVLRSCLLAVLAAAGAPAASAAQALRIYDIDVEQAAATLVVSPSGHTLLVDSGKNGHGPRILAALQAAGVASIDHFVATHYHEDHYGGIDEVVRAGILAVSRGQVEAAYSLGMRPGPTLRLIVVPQAMRVIIPPLTSQYLNLTKNSTLAVAIGYPDLVQIFTGTVLNQTGQAVSVVAVTMAVYLTISLATSLAMNIYNRRVALVER